MMVRSNRESLAAAAELILLPITWYASGAQDSFDKANRQFTMGLLYPLVGGMIGLLVVLIDIWTTNPATRSSASIPAGAESPWYKTTFGKLMISGPFMALIIPVALFSGERYKQHKCDRGAERALQPASASLDRLCHELQDLRCTALWRELSGDHLNSW